MERWLAIAGGVGIAIVAGWLLDMRCDQVRPDSRRGGAMAVCLGAMVALVYFQAGLHGALAALVAVPIGFAAHRWRLGLLRDRVSTR